MDWRKELNKKDPFDRQIIDLIEKGELTVGCIMLKEENKHATDL